jgi:haloacid dehalogenase superfamily, subfamily IA, variant 3 with third motif having DD or ED/haloacid dehalogenase superfamily, subfamily IA, variant 1 with third motif having Dx(3-4)D or Dx(3-4)E
MKAVVFDFFGVICSEITPFVLPRYLSPEETADYKASIVEEADLGHIDLPQVLEILSERTGASAAQLHAEFWAHVNINPAMVALIEEVKTRCRTALLSNAMNPFLRQVMAKHHLERLFDEIVISAEVDLTKPDRRIYDLVLQKLEIAPASTFFTDDNQNNIDAAQKAGMQAALFLGVDGLKAELAARGF